MNLFKVEIIYILWNKRWTKCRLIHEWNIYLLLQKVCFTAKTILGKVYWQLNNSTFRENKIHISYRVLCFANAQWLQLTNIKGYLLYIKHFKAEIVFLELSGNLDTWKLSSSLYTNENALRNLGWKVQNSYS